MWHRCKKLFTNIRLSIPLKDLTVFLPCKIYIQTGIKKMDDKNKTVQHFLDLIQKSRKGKFKVYIGMSAGVGKTFSMLQEAHALLRNGIDVKIGYIETHDREETHALLS